MDRKAAQQQHKEEAEPGCRIRSPARPAPAHEPGSGQRGHGVDVHAQDDGHALRHEIAQHAAADSRDDAEHHREDIGIARAERQSAQRSRDGERRKADGVRQLVEQRHRVALLAVNRERRVAARDEDGHHH